MAIKTDKKTYQELRQLFADLKDTLPKDLQLKLYSDRPREDFFWIKAQFVPMDGLLTSMSIGVKTEGVAVSFAEENGPSYGDFYGDQVKADSGIAFIVWTLFTSHYIACVLTGMDSEVRNMFKNMKPNLFNYLRMTADLKKISDQDIFLQPRLIIQSIPQGGF